MHLSNITPETIVTEEVVETLGFVHIVADFHDLQDSWVKNGVDIWEHNDGVWLISALEQAGIGINVTTVGQLDKFFTGCGLSLGLGVGLNHKQQSLANLLCFVENYVLGREDIEKPIQITAEANDSVEVSYFLKRPLVAAIGEETRLNNRLLDILKMIASHLQMDVQHFEIIYSTNREGGIVTTLRGLVPYKEQPVVGYQSTAETC